MCGQTAAASTAMGLVKNSHGYNREGGKGKEIIMMIHLIGPFIG